MKSFLSMITLCLVMAFTGTAQVQTGYVKTKGRLASNGRVIPGQRLSGTSVHIKGRTVVVSDANGSFSFPIPSSRFTIQSVKKQGYVLTDPETTSRMYSYTTTPLIIVMETPNEQTEDKLNNERKIRRTLQLQLKSKEDEIESLKAQNKITQEEYHKALQQLYSEQESNEHLISDMAERYTQIDFDQLDNFNLRISDCILNGRLTEADSLLRSKGDINDRISLLNQHHEANERTQSNLDKSKALEEKNREDIAQDCYNFYQKFLMEHQIDSAAHFLELRAKLDSSNIQWQTELIGFFLEYMDNYTLALPYIQLGLDQALNQLGDNNESTATYYDYFGDYYLHIRDFEKALDYFNKALCIREVAHDTEITAATSYNNIGLTYIYINDFQKAVDYFDKALAVEEITNSEIADSHERLGLVYGFTQDFAKAIEHQFIAVHFYEELLGSEHPTVATLYNNIGITYRMQGCSEKALEYCIKVRDIREQSLGTNNPMTAVSYTILGTIHYDMNDYDTALEYYTKALNIYNRVFGPESDNTASSYECIGNAYAAKQMWNKALDNYLIALPVIEQFYGNDDLTTGWTYLYIGIAYKEIGEYTKAEEYLSRSLEIRESQLGPENYQTLDAKAAIEDLYSKMSSNQY